MDEEEFEKRNEVTKIGWKLFKSMGDVELVLRFFAYRQINRFPGGLNKIGAFLDRFLIEGNKFRQEILSEYEDMFEKTISFISQLLGKKAFCPRNRDGKPRGRSTMFIYDPLMFISSQYIRGKDRETLLSGKKVLVNELSNMYKEHGSIFAGRRTNVADMNQRNERVSDVFRNALKKMTT